METCVVRLGKGSEVVLACATKSVTVHDRMGLVKTMILTLPTSKSGAGKARNAVNSKVQQGKVTTVKFV